MNNPVAEPSCGGARTLRSVQEVRQDQERPPRGGQTIPGTAYAAVIHPESGSLIIDFSKISNILQFFKRDADELEIWIREKLETAKEESYRDTTNLQVIN